MTEPTLFPVEPLTPKLTERQQFVYDQLLAHTAQGDGLSSDEVGAMLHARRDKHDEGTRCSWCQPDGLGVLKALRKKGLAKRRRGGTWVALVDGDSVGGGSAAAGGDEIPF